MIKNFRIVHNVKDDYYYIQYQKKFFNKNYWFNYKNVDKYSGISISPFYNSNYLTYIILPLLYLSVIGMIFLFAFTGPTFFSFKTERFNLRCARREIRKIKEKLHEEEIKKKKIKKVGTKEIVEIYKGDHIIDKRHLKLNKKIKRILNKKL